MTTTPAKKRPVDPYDDFRNFLFAVFTHLGIRDVTRVQYDIARFLQHGPKRAIIEAFRGVGKSWITAAYVLWVLRKNPQLKVMIVSASDGRASNFTLMLLRLIHEMPELRHLAPKDDQRKSMKKFDVGPATTDQSPSVKSVGITGQITGDRADIIIADDIEIPKNSATEVQRQKIAEAVKEFDAVLKPKGRVIFLGTPQTEFSLYNTLQTRGYACRVWPARYPNGDQAAYYGARLAPMLAEDIKTDPSLVGRPTEPTRFDDKELDERMGSYGRSGFDLQFMLDTRLSDLHRYPLRLSDLVVLAANPDDGPEKVIWASSPDRVWSDLPSLGLEGDRFYQPMQVVGDWVPYQSSVMFIDPSGRGKDETGWVVVKSLNGFVYLLGAGGYRQGYTDEVLIGLAETAKKFKVNKILVEKNYGDGMFVALLKPHVGKIFPATIEEVPTGNTQKELRIADTLEPVMAQHRLVVDASVVRQDWETTQGGADDDSSPLTYSLFWQMSRLTRERGALAHDDRLDALAGAVRYFTEHFKRDADRAIQSRQNDLMRKEIEAFLRSPSARPLQRPQPPTWNRLRRVPA